MAVINVKDSPVKKTLAVSTSEYMKNHIYLKCRGRYEDMMINHRSCSCKIKAWKKFRLEWDSNP